MEDLFDHFKKQLITKKSTENQILPNIKLFLNRMKMQRVFFFNNYYMYKGFQYQVEFSMSHSHTTFIATVLRKTENSLPAVKSKKLFFV